MGRINMPREIVGGLVAGPIINIKAPTGRAVTV